MSHIIILDENGNEIGRSEPGDEPPINGLAAATETPTTPEIHIRMDLAKVKDLMHGNEAHKPKTE